MTLTRPGMDLEIAVYDAANNMPSTALSGTYMAYDAVRRTQVPLVDAVFSATFSFMEEEDEVDVQT